MQNINLYQVEHKRRDGPSPRQMILGWVVLLVLMLLHAGWQAWQLRQHTAQADAAQLRAQQLEGDFERAKGSFRAPQLDPSLPLQLAKQEAANQQLQRLVSHLQRLGAQQRSGFVAPLAGLSERHPPTGLWLSRIRLAEGGSQMSLQGFSQDQELLPLYLQSLGVSPVFSGRAFADFELQRNEAGVLSFRLASRLKDEGHEHE